MRHKFRLIATLLSLALVIVVFSVGVPLALKAAQNASVTGSGSLNYEFTYSNQKSILEECGFHVTGNGPYILQMQESSDDSGGGGGSSSGGFDSTQMSTYREKAIENNILRFELYEKKDCNDSIKTIYELQIVLDFHNFGILDYAKYSVGWYNKIVFAKTSDGSGGTTDFTTSVDLYDFETGEKKNNSGSITVTFHTDTTNTSNPYYYCLSCSDGSTICENANKTYVFKIILSKAQDANNEENTYLRNNSFYFYDFKEKDTKKTKASDDDNKIDKDKAPIVYLDFSYTALSTETSGNTTTLKGIKFGESPKENKNSLASSSDNDMSEVELTQNKHIHMIGNTDTMCNSVLELAEEYITDHNKSKASRDDNNYQIDIYKKNSEYSYTYLYKVTYNGSLSVTTISKENKEGSEEDQQ